MAIRYGFILVMLIYDGCFAQDVAPQTSDADALVRGSSVARFDQRSRYSSQLMLSNRFHWLFTEKNYDYDLAKEKFSVYRAGRRRLQMLIALYPQSPEAVTAKVLLESLPSVEK